MVRYLLYRAKWNLAKYIVPKHPLHIDFELSSLCNLVCQFCPQSEGQPKTKEKFMDIGLFTRIITDIQGKVPSIKLNLRGESTMHPNFLTFLDLVRGRFVDIRMNTNGQYPDKLNHGIATTCKEISFSCDALYPETYKKIRPKADYELLWQNIQAIYYENPKILKVSYTLCDQNKDELQHFKDYMKVNYPKAKIFVKPAMQRTGTNFYLGDRKAIGRKNCLMPNRRLSISSDGLVFPCCLQWREPYFVMGDAKREKIFDIWSNIKSRMTRKMLRNGNAFEAIFQCKECGSSESYVWG